MSNNDLPGGPTRVIRFDEGERTNAAPVTPAAATRPDSEPAYDGPASTAAPTPTRTGRDWRPWLLGGAAAVALGVVSALLLAPKDEREGRTATAETTTTTTTEARAGADTAPVATGPTIAAASEAYRDPDAAPVERALLAVRADYGSGGASAVARQARACFDSLARSPNYTELDYCLSYDAYGAALARRLAQGQPLPAGSWFADTEARAIRTANAVIGGQGDAAARLLDIRRLTVQVAAANPAAAGTRVAEAPAPTPRPVEVAEAPTRPEFEAPEAPRAREPQVAPRPPEAVPAPRPAPVQRAAVGSARPSFNCRYARSASEQMVCSDPVLAAADWRLHNVFERAMANAADPRGLRSEQDRWLAAREGAAPDPRAVLQVYETRIDELSARY